MKEHSTDTENILNSQEYQKNREEAEKLLQKPDQLEMQLRSLEEKLSQIPAVGGILSNVPVLISMVRSYIRKEYTALPLATIIAAVAALLYVLSPVDIIPDIIPGLGFADDAAVISFTMAMIGSDLKAYREWRQAREENGDIRTKP